MGTSSITGSIADETTRLVITSEAVPTTQTNGEASLLTPPKPPNNQNNEDDKPLPKFQIFLLCYARVVEPIAFFSIFPFINKMIFETGGIDEARVGFYAGLIESLFSLTQMAVMLFWGRAADKYGRKPVLVSSLFGVGIATSLFGLSQQIWQMILFRCLAGVFAGTVVTIRSMISEHSTPKTQARAFSWFAFAGNLGIFLGPIIGGVLADPAKEYKSIFGGIQFFKDYPYALPTFVTGFIGLTAAIINALFVTETLTTDLRASNKASSHASMTPWELLKFPGVFNVVIIYGWTMLLGLAYTAVVPIFWFTSIPLGGLGFTPMQIALFLGLSGVSQATWILLAFPPLHRRLGSGALLRLCAFVWVLMFAAWPVANMFLRRGMIVPFWIVAVVFNIEGSGVSMAFTAVQLALNDIAPSPATLGTLNALALGLVAGTRAVAPAAFASTFAVGVKKQIFSGYLIWVVLVALAVGENGLVRWMPAKVEGGLIKKPVDEEEEGS